MVGEYFTYSEGWNRPRGRWRGEERKANGESALSAQWRKMAEKLGGDRQEKLLSWHHSLILNDDVGV